MGLNRNCSTAIIPILLLTTATCRADDFAEILTGLKRAKETVLNSEGTATLSTSPIANIGSEPTPVSHPQTLTGSDQSKSRTVLWSFTGERTFLRAEKEERGRYWDGSTWTSGTMVSGVFYARSSPAANSSPNPVEEPVSVGYRLPPAFQAGPWIADYAAVHPPSIQKVGDANWRLTWHQGESSGTTLRLIELSVDINPKQGYQIVRTFQEDRYISFRLSFGEFLGTVEQTSLTRHLDVISAGKLGKLWLPTSVSSRVVGKNIEPQTTGWKVLAMAPKASSELLHYYHEGDVVDRAGSRFVARADGSFGEFKPPETAEEQEARSDLAQYVLLIVVGTGMILLGLYSRTILKLLRRPAP